LGRDSARWFWSVSLSSSIPSSINGTSNGQALTGDSHMKHSAARNGILISATAIVAARANYSDVVDFLVVGDRRPAPPVQSPPITGTETFAGAVSEWRTGGNSVTKRRRSLFGVLPRQHTGELEAIALDRSPRFFIFRKARRAGGRRDRKCSHSAANSRSALDHGPSRRLPESKTPIGRVSLMQRQKLIAVTFRSQAPLVKGDCPQSPRASCNPRCLSDDFLRNG